MHITQLGQDDLIRLAKYSKDRVTAKISIDALVKQRDAPIDDLKWIALTTIFEDVAFKAVRGLLQNGNATPATFAMITKGCEHEGAAVLALEELLNKPPVSQHMLMQISLASCPKVKQMAQDALEKFPTRVPL